MIEEQYGNLTVVAKKCNVVRATVKNWINKDKSGKLELALQAGKEKFVDFAELKALDLIAKGNVNIITLILRTLGKSRGYVEQKRFDPNVVGDLDLTQSQTGKLEFKVKHVLIESRADLERVYQGDSKQIENKTIDNVLETIDAEFIEEK
jgi:hypothetical protein